MYSYYFVTATRNCSAISVSLFMILYTNRTNDPSLTNLKFILSKSQIRNQELA